MQWFQQYLDELIVFEPGDVRLWVAQGDAGQHGLGLQQESEVGGRTFDLRSYSATER